MQIEILGSGGALATPRAGSTARTDVEAREKGIPYARSGPSTFIHGPQILFDTPEESRLQLVRAGIDRVNACFYSHWHPDHTMGRRVWESLNMRGRGAERTIQTTDIYLPEQVAIDFRAYLGHWDHLQFLASVDLIRVHEMKEGERVTIDDVLVTPIKLAEPYVYAFLVQDDATNLFIAMDELVGWQPGPDLTAIEFDLVQLPIGVFEFDPVTGARCIAADDPILRTEATFTETLAIARSLSAREIAFSHIEALDELSHDVLVEVATGLRTDGLPATIAWDGLIIDTGAR